jgi:hypothetical protein
MDSIWNCAFGVDIDLQNNLSGPDNMYYHKCEKVFKQGTELVFVNYLGSIYIYIYYLLI